jgi:hypothetical protein
MFNLHHNKITIVFLDGLYPVALRQAVRDRGPETLKAAVQEIYSEYFKFAHHNERYCYYWKIQITKVQELQFEQPLFTRLFNFVYTVSRGVCTRILCSQHL